MVSKALKNKFKSTFILLLLCVQPLFAQVDGLALLGSLTEGMPQNISEQDNSLNSEIDEQQEKNSDKSKENFADDQYGFTGGDRFKSAPKSKFSKYPLEYFGYNYFIEQPSTFAQFRNIPVPPDYLIGPNDNIKIILFGSNNSKYDLTVTRDGDIFIPEIGPVYVAGITFQDMKKSIEQIVSSELIGTNANVTLGSLRSIDVFVLGAAKNPGMYSISALSTLTNAIIKSGGIDTSGSLRNISHKRNGEVINTFDFYDLLLEGDTSNDSRLMQGDVIFIEPIGKTAGVNGEVNRPGIYELKDQETLSDLLEYAGRPKPKANLGLAEITRINSSSNSFDLLSINLNDNTDLQRVLNNGDVLSIYSVQDNLKKAVLVKGHALQPGFFPWNDGMKIGDIFNSSDDLLEMTDLNYILIKRNQGNSKNYDFIQVDLERVFDDPSAESNVVLKEQDEILILPSLLPPDQITTKLIQDKYLYDEETEQFVIEDEWTSLTYLRKSLMEEKVELDKQNTVFMGDRANSSALDPSELDQRRYYEYTIHDYCTLSEDIAIKIIEVSGFRAKKSIPIEDLENITKPEEFIALQQTLERERIKSQDQGEADELSQTITSVCRNQLLDPMLDVIRRNDTDDKLNLVSVFGNVHFPGEYPFTKDMILSDAIKAAGGPKNGTYEAEIELSQMSKEDKKFKTTNNYASLKEASDINLKEMDTVILKQLSTNTQTVEITGEVYFPGVYPISENQTLGELLRRAGGVTEYGSASAAYFQRQALKEAETERLRSAQEELRRKILLSSQAGGLGQNTLDSNAITQLTNLITSDTEDTEVLGRLVIDLESILEGTVEDIILEDGDTLYIPKNIQSVSVIGEVFVANSHLYQAKLSLDDYINLSGGVTTFADRSSLYLIKSDGSVVSPSQLSSGFFRSGGSILEPGDTIVIPIQVQPFSGIKATTEVTQIIYQMALAAAAVNSF